jgi:predicted RNA-binding protein YlqC (UPF0109 family)
MAEKDQEFLEFVVKGLVEHPDDVKINRTVDEMGVLLTLDLHGDDMGKVIGRSGNTAKAIRTLLRVVGMKHNARVNLKINEPAGSTRGNGTWDSGSSASASSSEPSPNMKSVDEAMEDLKF